MDFTKYQHLERLGSNEVEGITAGLVYVFPKLDGTNASVWMDDTGNIKAGSRNRELSLEKDNAGFFKHVLENESTYRAYLEKHPNRILYGEWLVPHSLKTYRDDAWRKFYVFDVLHFDDNESLFYYLKPDDYLVELEECSIACIHPIAKVKNGRDEKFRELCEKNTFLIKENEGFGEGIVLKNYDYVNRYGRVVWAKVITNQFKEEHVRVMGGEIHGGEVVEEKIVNKYVTQHLVDKTYAKICNEDGWSQKSIPRLLNTVFHDLIKEEAWDFIKEFKNPKIDFQFMHRLTISKIKELKSDLF